MFIPDFWGTRKFDLFTWNLGGIDENQWMLMPGIELCRNIHLNSSSDARTFNAFQLPSRGIKVLNCLGNNFACKHIVDLSLMRCTLEKTVSVFLRNHFQLYWKDYNFMWTWCKIAPSTCSWSCVTSQYRYLPSPRTVCIPSNLQQLPE